jgi:hypothetical protein
VHFVLLGYEMDERSYTTTRGSCMSNKDTLITGLLFGNKGTGTPVSKSRKRRSGGDAASRNIHLSYDIICPWCCYSKKKVECCFGNNQNY